MFKFLIILPSLIFASLFGYIRYGMDLPLIAKHEPKFIGEAVIMPSWYTETAIGVLDIYNRPESYLAYDYELSELIEMDSSTKLYKLSNYEKQVFHAETGTASLSPNGQYIIYHRSNSGIAVGDLTTGRYVSTDIPVLDGTYFVWAQNSSGFIATWYYPSGDGAQVDYVRVNNLQHPLEKLDVYRAWSSSEVRDLISPAGDYLLFSSSYYTGSALGLYLWNTQTQQSQYIFPNEHVVGAAFIPNEPDAIYAIVADGLIKYNFRTNSRQIIHPELNSNIIFHAKFSPDLSHLAILAGSTGEYESSCKMYVVRLWEEYIKLQNLAEPCSTSG